MSVRIYQISKETGVENKKILELLRDRGFEVKSASSSIDNISAEALIDELKQPSPADEVAAEPKPVAEEKPVPRKQTLPKGAIVKSTADIEREKLEKAEAAQAEAQAKIAAARSEKHSAATAVKAPALPPQRTTPMAKAPAPPPAAPGKAPAPPPIAKPKVTQAENAGAQSSSTAAPDAHTSEGKSPAPIAPPPAGQTVASSTEDAGSEGNVIHAKPPIVVREFSAQLGLKPFRLISELMEMGIFASMNQSIEEDIAQKLAEKHGFILEIRHRGEGQEAQPEQDEEPEIDESKFLKPRPPVVCVLGHVDHGKTTLLDSIRKANVVKGEAGGITQHIGAYQIEHNKHKITFIDTPGHAAFSKMRQRGAAVTDIAVLVVAADDAFMPQTDEALKFLQKANVPIVVAINKMDVKGANIDRTKQQMQERNIAPEDWGGETLCTPVSALSGENMDELLELILLQAEIGELKANPDGDAEGVIIESQMEVGRGSTATIIVQKGTLKVGDAIVCGTEYCKIRAMIDENGKRLKSAPPSTPARLLGWSGSPEAGATFKVVKNEKVAKREAEEHRIEAKAQLVTKKDSPAGDLQSLLAAIDSQSAKVFRVVIKGDVHGSVEALAECLQDIKSDKVSLEIIESGVGQVSKNDVSMASTSGAAVIAFNVKQDNGVSALAKHHDVQIISHNIIYELIEQVKEGMAELLEPERRENKTGAAEVRQIFPVAKGFVAGCMVTEGKILRDAFARVLRNGEVIAESKIGTLKRFKDDVAEVRAGYECGIQVEGYNKYEEGDTLECYEIQEFRASL